MRYLLSQTQEFNKMSLENRKRQYKMFMARGQKDLAEQQLNSPSLKEKRINIIEEEPTKSKGKK